MDILRGILIILVIVGHSIADIESLTIPFNLIYSFHIPLLIFCSGYIEEEYSEKYLYKRSRMLIMRICKILLPYLILIRGYILTDFLDILQLACGFLLYCLD